MDCQGGLFKTSIRKACESSCLERDPGEVGDRSKSLFYFAPQEYQSHSQAGLTSPTYRTNSLPKKLCFRRSCNIYFIPANIFFWGQVCSASPSQGWIDCCTCIWKRIKCFSFKRIYKKDNRLINNSTIMIQRRRTNFKFYAELFE